MKASEKIAGILFNIRTLGFYRYIETSVHHGMIEDELNENPNYAIKKADYAEFEKEFEKIDWKIKYPWTRSLFTDNNQAYFHASIIRINNTLYKFTAYGLFRANRLKNKKIEQINTLI